MSEDGKLTAYEKRVIQALKDRNPLRKGKHLQSQLPFLALDMVMYISNGEMTLELPSLNVAIRGQEITYQGLFSEFGDMLDGIVNDPDGFQRKRMS